jgi:hypothetical protein
VSFLVPLTIAGATFYFSQRDKLQNELSKSHEIKMQEIQRDMDQAKLLSQFIEPLCSPDTNRRKLAVGAINIAFASDTSLANTILSSIILSDPAESVQNFASLQKLQSDENSDMQQLIHLMFDPQKPVRQSATELLLQRYSSESNMIKEMIKFASQKEHHSASPQNMSGTINVLVVLQALPLATLRANEQVINPYLSSLRSLNERPQTIEYADKISARLNK